MVISDRYVDSSLAYQGAGRTLPVDEVSWLSSWATGGLKPDLVVLLDVDPRTGLARVGRAQQRRRPAGGRVARRSTSGSGTRSSTSPPPTRSATWCSTRPGRPTRSPRWWSGRVEELLGKPGGIVHPRPAQGPDTSVQPELSDAELVTMEHTT